MSFQLCAECGAERTDPGRCIECGRIERTPEQIAHDVRAMQGRLELAAKLADVEAKSDIEVERLKACEAIADGDPGWEVLRDICPSTNAVAALRSRLSTALASLAAVTVERDAAIREADRLRHGVAVEGDFVCPDSLALTEARAESERLLTELAVWKEEHVEVCAQRAEWLADRDAAVAESERLRTALTKISAIRDSIVGMQGFNFSEHAYPLVAALGEAGFDGAGYEIARKNLGTLIEQRDAADAESERLRGEVERLALTADEREALGVLRFLLGKHSHEPYAYEGEDVETALAALDKLIGGGK